MPSKICPAPGCGKLHSRTTKLCAMHYSQFKRHGDFIRLKARRGDGCLDSNGYIKVMANGIHTYEHRQVMENKLGRQLLPTEHVHHINGVRSDNRPENLQVVSRGEHNTIHGNRRS